MSHDVIQRPYRSRVNGATDKSPCVRVGKDGVERSAQTLDMRSERLALISFPQLVFLTKVKGDGEGGVSGYYGGAEGAAVTGVHA